MAFVRFIAGPGQTTVDAREQGERGPVARRFVVAHLFVASAGVLVARWWVSRHRHVYHVWPDEPGQLAIARFLGSGGRWSMLDHSTRRPGYGTLIAPLTWFTDDPVTMFRSALAVNAVLGCLSCLLLCFLARRLTNMTPRCCVAAAVVVSLAPAVLLTTTVAWAESLVQLAVVSFLLAAIAFHDHPSIRRGAILITSVAVAVLAHSRLLPLAAVAAALIGILALTRRCPRLRGALLLATLAAALSGAARFSAFVVERVWDDPAPTNTAGSVISQLTPVRPVLASVAGQTWYQLVATAGLAGLGTLALLRAAVSRDLSFRTDALMPIGKDSSVSRADAVLTLVSVGSLVALSMVFIADRTRPDHLVYGRYNDAAMAPIVLLGIGVLATASRTRVVRDGALTLAVLAASGGLLVRLAGDELAGPGTVRMMIVGLLSFIGTSLTIEALPLTVIAGLLLAGLGALAVRAQRRARPAIVLAAVLALALAGQHRARPAVDQRLNSLTFEQAESLDGALPGDTLVRVRLRSPAAEPTVGVDTLRIRMAEYQFALPDNSFVLDGLEGRQTPYIIAAAGDAELSAAEATVVWRDPEAPIALWYVNGE